MLIGRAPIRPPPAPLARGAARRARRARAPPRLRRGADGWMLELAGEPPCPRRRSPTTIRSPARSRPSATASTASRSRCRSPLGIELLPAAEAQPLLDAFHDGVAELGDPFRFWAATALTAPGAGALEIDALLDRGALGATVPAGALASEVGLVRLVRAARPPAGARRAAVRAPRPGAAPAHRGAPAWWPAMTAYVADMHAAWHAWAAWGRARAPAAARAVRDAGRRRAAARRAPRRPRRPGRRGARRADASSTSPPTGRGPSTRCCASSASTGSSTAPTARSSSRPRSAPSARPSRHALAEANPARLLSPDPVTA